jgi:hypothetical protein
MGKKETVADSAALDQLLRYRTILFSNIDHTPSDI